MSEFDGNIVRPPLPISGVVIRPMVVTTDPTAGDTTVLCKVAAISGTPPIWTAGGDEIEVQVVMDPGTGYDVLDCSPSRELGAKLWAIKWGSVWWDLQTLLVGTEC